MAFSPDAPPLQLGWDAPALERLRTPDTALFDRASRPIYGDLEVGQDIWVEGRRLQLGGYVELGPTIVVDGLLVVSESTMKSMNPDTRPKMAVLRLAPGADPARVKQAIRALLDGDLDVYQAGDLAAREAAYLRHAAPIGLLFGAGMSAGLFVGLVICYQSLYVAIRRRIDAFATLKAIGFGNAFITRVVLQQTALYAAGGFLLGLALATAAYDWLARISGLAIDLNVPRIAAIALGCLLVCLVAGLLVSRQVIRSDPAELY
jgi:putative ABC transport system permease protein